MPNQILPLETRKTSRTSTATATRSLVMTTSGPICHLRVHRNPRFAAAELVTATRHRTPYPLTLTPPPTPRSHVLKSETQFPAITIAPQVKSARAQRSFLRKKIQRFDLFHYCALMVVLANTAGLLTGFLVKVLTAQP